MRKLRLNHLFAALILICLMLSCQKENDLNNLQHEPSSLESKEESTGMTVLGEQLENPYSIENMKKALNKLQNEPQLKSASDSLDLLEFEIKTTHLYVRFLPKDSLEMIQLEKDSLVLFDYPLDYEIKEGGEFYQDPSIPEDQITWQYTTVKSDYKFPDIKHEILQECFIIEEEDDNLKSTQTNTWALLEYRAMKMTNNLTEEELAQEKENNLKGWFKGWFPKKKRPHGYIRVFDTEENRYVGVKGVKVRAHRIVKVSHGYTDQNGYYRVNKTFRYSCFYGLSFQSVYGPKLWKWYTSLTVARYSMGYHSRNGYSRNIPTSSIVWRLATVMNGVYDYYGEICPRYGIGRPHHDLRICVTKGLVGGAPMIRRVYHPIGHNSHSGWDNFIVNAQIGVVSNILIYMTKTLQPDIMIGGGSGNSARIYSQVVHELAHASHFRKVGSYYWSKYINYIITYGISRPYGDGTGKNSDLCAVGEMWGYHIGYQAMFDKYGNLGNYVDINDVENFDPRSTPFRGNIWMTHWLPQGLLWDLQDTHQDIINGILDNAHGFTINQFYNALDSDIDSPQDFKNRLMKETNNRQKQEVDELFEAYHWN